QTREDLVAHCQALDRVLREGQAGLIFITEKLAMQIREEIETLVLGGKFPLVLEIPDRKGSLGQRTRIREIVGRAIGVQF
ncbi:MAG TPA: V-type ATP synthase subunit F, partial [bacterium]|nr:V-type ATP synthase subunit F [bacterium]